MAVKRETMMAAINALGEGGTAAGTAILIVWPIMTIIVATLLKSKV